MRSSQWASNPCLWDNTVIEVSRSLTLAPALGAQSMCILRMAAFGGRRLPSKALLPSKMGITLDSFGVLLFELIC